MRIFSFRLPVVSRQLFYIFETFIVFLLLLTFVERVDILVLKRLGQVLSYPFLLVVTLCYWRQICSLLYKDWFLVGLTFIAIFSVGWSVYPEITAPNSRGLIRSTLFGVYFAMRYDVRDQLRLLAGVFACALLFSFLLAIAFPSVGVHTTGPHFGLWKGIFAHKNFLGRNMTLSAQIFLLLALYYRKWQIRCLLYTLFLLSIALVLLSRSTTALVAFLSVTPLLVAYKFLQRKYYKARVLASVSVLLTLITISSLAISSAELLLATQGKDLTFTGRSTLWNMLIQEYIPIRLFWGYGYRAFWPANSESINLGGWLPGHAHNSVLELLLALGLVGLSFYLLSLIPTLFRAFHNMFTAKSVLNFWYLQFVLILLIIDSMGMSSALDPVNLQWMLFVCTTFSLRKTRMKTKI